MNHITIIVALAFALFLAAALASNTILYAQQVPSSSSHSSPPLLHLQGPSVKLHAVKIASPARGQQVPIGKNLTVSGVTSTLGTPTGNTATSHCQVSVVANGAKPYQPAKGTGPGGAADYSTWSYILSSKYTTIKPGPDNKITAKYTCTNNPKEASFYSVNVTGRANNLLHTAQIAAPNTGVSASPRTPVVSSPHTPSPSPTSTAVKQKEQQPVITGNSDIPSSIGLNTPVVTNKQKPVVATSNSNAAGLNNNSSAIVAGISIPGTPGTTTAAVTYEQKPVVATSNSSATSSLLDGKLINIGSSELSGQLSNLSSTDHRNHGYDRASSSSSSSSSIESTQISHHDTSSHKAPRIHSSAISHHDTSSNKAPRIHSSAISHQDNGNGNPSGTLHHRINELQNRIMDNVKRELESNGIRVSLP